MPLLAVAKPADVSRPLTPEERATLPKNSGNTLGRAESWVIIASAPLLVMPLIPGETERRRFNVDRTWLLKRVSDYRQLISSGYYEAGHISEHKKGDGKRGGDVARLDVWTDPRDSRDKLLAEIRWTGDYNPQDDIKAGTLRYASPSWVTFTDELGTKWPMALSEVSAVVAPHQKHIAAQHYLSEQAEVQTEDLAVEEALKKIMESLAAVTARLDKMEKANTDAAEAEAKDAEDATKADAEAADVNKAKLAEDTKANTKATEADKPKATETDKPKPTDAETELEALRKQVAALLDAQKRNDFKAGAAKSLGKMSEDVAEAAYQLSESNGEAFGTLISHLNKQPKMRMPTKFQWNLGESATPAANGSLTREQCAAQVKETGGDTQAYYVLCKANGHVL